uniref:SH3 domain-containing protein n=1 Tax=Rhabditophanes sp. KR3021 TaxID=114890 RepID=A0AC35TGI9_9BILA
MQTLKHSVPFIPEPDYESPGKDDRGQRHSYQPVVPKRSSQAVNPDNFHTYKNVEDLYYNKPTNKDRALSIAKKQGVAVFPVFNNNNNETSLDSDKVVVPNAAMLLHVKNHKKFDDKHHNYESCKNCPICKSTATSSPAISPIPKEETNYHLDANRNVQADNYPNTNVNNVYSQSKQMNVYDKPEIRTNINQIRPRQNEVVGGETFYDKAFQKSKHIPYEPGYVPPLLLDINTTDNLSYPNILYGINNFASNPQTEEKVVMKFIVMNPFKGGRLDELTVKTGEIVIILRIEGAWCLVKNQDDLEGWIPYPKCFQ